ncbi:MAG: Gfo/Idh/MocA family oxidoreductase [Planctomycetes bacterium]|nr:Gfo/Idh/MocA family oxidoreductase [Planctomycetota bacterium]
MTTPHEPRPAPSRRDFLFQSAAVAGTAPLFLNLQNTAPIPAAAPGATLRPGDPIRIGVIGTGGMGTAHCNAFLRLQGQQRFDMRIVALADVCQSRLESARKQCADKQPGQEVLTYGNYTELLARKDIHGVLIASPEHWHAKMAEDAILAGKDVYCEKPMTYHLADALRLWDVVKQNPDRLLQVGTQYIMQERYIETQRLIAAGEIGAPTWSQTSYCRNSKDGEWNYYAIDDKWEPGVNLDWESWCGPSGKAPWDPKVYARWRRYKRYSTGIIGDLLVHQMTPLIMAIDQGWPVRVIASGSHIIDKAMENHDQVNLTIEFETGHVMTVAGSTCNEEGMPVMVRGHKATLFLGSEDVVLRPQRIFADEVDEQKIQCKVFRDDQDELRVNWIDSIRTRTPNRSQVELGAKVMVIVDLAARSMWTGKAWSYDPKARTAQAI